MVSVKSKFMLKFAMTFVPTIMPANNVIISPFVHEQVCGIVQAVNGTEPVIGLALVFSWIWFGIHSWQSYIQPDIALQALRDQVTNAQELTRLTNELLDFARSLPESPVIHYLQIDGIVTSIVIPDDLYELRMKDLYNDSIWSSLCPTDYEKLSWQTTPIDPVMAQINWDAWVNYERYKEISDEAERQVYLKSNVKHTLERTIEQLHETKKNEIWSTAQKFSVATSIIIVGVAACYYYENDCICNDKK